MKTFLFVPFSEKDEAKALGARWDSEEKRWYAPENLSKTAKKDLAKWMPGEELEIKELVGEDRNFLGNNLFVDLIPNSCWFKNVRSEVTVESWDQIRRIVYSRAGNKCEICGAGKDVEAKRYIEAHERWDYDDKAGIQKLMRLIALCSDCHTVTHFGLAQVRGLREEALAHLMKVTGMNREKAEEHVAEAFRIWAIRSKKEWKLDLSILTDSNVRLLN